MEDIELKMTQQITIGIDGTDIRAGVRGELGTSGDTIFPNEEKVLIAAGRVNNKTNVPTMVHDGGRKETVMAALGILKNKGANVEGFETGRTDHGHTFAV